MIGKIKTFISHMSTKAQQFWLQAPTTTPQPQSFDFIGLNSTMHLNVLSYYYTNDSSNGPKGGFE